MKKTYAILLIFFCTIIQAQTSLSVMSYNIRFGSANDGENNWDKRKEKLVALLSYYEAPLIGIQEAQKFQIDYILQNMPNYKAIGKPREYRDLAEYSCILYNANEYKVLEDQTLWLSQTPMQMSKGWDAVCYRIVTYGLFQNRKTKQKLWFLNTHFDHQGIEARNNSANFLSTLIQQLQTQKKVSVILSGDFNATLADTCLQTLKDNLYVAFEQSKTKPYGNSGTWNAFDFQKQPTEQIDHIFFDKNSSITVQKYHTIDDFYNFKYPSDHLPIMASFIIH